MSRLAQGFLSGCLAAGLVATALWTTMKVGPSPEQQMCALRADIERTLWKTQQQQAALFREMEASQHVQSAKITLAWAMTSDPIQRAHNVRTAAEFVADTERSAENYRLSAERYEAGARGAAWNAMRQCPEVPH